MCGRYQLTAKGKEVSERFMIELFDELHRPQRDSATLPKGYNCAPMQWLPVITNANPQKISHFRWGLLPSWIANTAFASRMINCRAETVHQKPAFRQAFRLRRCLVPANAFYEWRKDNGQPFRIFLKNEPLFAMAGIWEEWKPKSGEVWHTFSIITIEANRLMQHIHHRMPVILPRHSEHVWLHSADEAVLRDCLRPLDEAQMDFYPVSRALNNVQNDNEKLISPEPLQQNLFG